MAKKEESLASLVIPAAKFKMGEYEFQYWLDEELYKIGNKIIAQYRKFHKKK